MYRSWMFFYMLLISHLLLTTACAGHDKIKKDMRDSVSREGDKLKEELKKEFVSMFGNLASDLMSKERDRFKKEFVSMLQEKLPATLDQYIALKLASINATNSGNISSLFQSLFHAPSNTMSGQVVQENDASDDDPVPNLFFHDSR